ICISSVANVTMSAPGCHPPTYHIQLPLPPPPAGKEATMPHPRPNRLLTFFLLLPLLAVPVAAGAEEIHAKLIGYQEVPSVSTVARGEFRAEISRDGSAIVWELSFRGLRTLVSMAIIHYGQVRVIGRMCNRLARAVLI